MATQVEMGELRADTPHCGRAAKVKAQLRSVELRAPRVPRNSELEEQRTHAPHLLVEVCG